jgi:DNA-binding NarL/FixJ family response regulator
MEEESHRGITLLKDLRADHRALRAVVLLDSSKPQEVVEAFRAGACGVFCRNTEIEVLCKCIAAVHGGQIWASSQELAFVLGALAVQRPPQFDSQCLPSLSTREKEVVRCLVEGFTNNQIAETLAISQHTVKNYLFKIFDKMGVANRVELVYRVLNAPAVLAASLRPDRVANLYLPAAVNVLLPNPIEPQLKKPAQPVPPFVESGPATVTARALSKAVG